MGKRFVFDRYRLHRYSMKRAGLRLNESDFEPHAMRPYGFASGKFTARQMFAKKHASRSGRQAGERAAKKTTRRWFFQLWKEGQV